MGPQILLNFKSVSVGLAMYFGESWQTAALPRLSGCYRVGAHPARLDHDVSEEAAGWAQQVDIRPDLERERF